MTALPTAASPAAHERRDCRIGVLLAGAARALAASSPTPRLDAEVLLGHSADLPRSALLAFPERCVDATAGARFAAAIERRTRGEPVAYIRGEKEFYSLPIRVTPSVLIPRADTEVLVEATLEYLDFETPCSVLDVGTGSGAIALAIKRERPRATVTALDCDAAALAVAGANAARLGLEILCVKSNWLEALEGALEHRGSIDMAKGALMLGYGLDDDQAFDLLRSTSTSSNVKVQELARRLVHELASSEPAAGEPGRIDTLMARVTDPEYAGEAPGDGLAALAGTPA